MNSIVLFNKEKLYKSDYYPFFAKRNSNKQLLPLKHYSTTAGLKKITR